jgi:hypothetical protein
VAPTGFDLRRLPVWKVEEPRGIAMPENCEKTGPRIPQALQACQAFQGWGGGVPRVLVCELHARSGGVRVTNRVVNERRDCGTQSLMSDVGARRKSREIGEEREDGEETRHLWHTKRCEAELRDECVPRLEFGKDGKKGFAPAGRRRAWGWTR